MQRARRRLALALRHAAQLQPEGDVAQDRRPGHQREVLEHERALGPRAPHRAAVDQDLAAVGSISPATILSSVVLPQPDGPSSVVSWPRGKLDVDAGERLDPARIDHPDAAHLDQIVGRGSGPAAVRARALRSRASPLTPAGAPGGTRLLDLLQERDGDARDA